MHVCSYRDETSSVCVSGTNFHNTSPLSLDCIGSLACSVDLFRFLKLPWSAFSPQVRPCSLRLMCFLVLSFHVTSYFFYVPLTSLSLMVLSSSLHFGSCGCGCWLLWFWLLKPKAGSLQILPLRRCGTGRLWRFMALYWRLFFRFLWLNSEFLALSLVVLYTWFHPFTFSMCFGYWHRPCLPFLGGAVLVEGEKSWDPACWLR